MSCCNFTIIFALFFIVMYLFFVRSDLTKFFYNSGSNSPYQQQQQQPNFVTQNPSVSGISTQASRLQPPPQQPPTSTMGSYISSPRGSPTPSSVGSSVNQAGDNGGPPGDPNSISAYSDGGTTYFYNPDEVPPVSYIFFSIKKYLYNQSFKKWNSQQKGGTGHWIVTYIIYVTNLKFFYG